MRKKTLIYLLFTSWKQVTFQVADALEQPFSDGQFDLVWSMESGEHMPDKKKVTIFEYLRVRALELLTSCMRS